MDFIGSAIAWFADPAHWQGGDGIPTRVVEHVELSSAALLVAMALALPLGLWIGHTGRVGLVVVNLANIGRALPSLAILGLALPLTIRITHQLDFWPTLVALVALGIPPILTNASIAIREVDPEVVEAARGMGMRGREVLLHVELPIALPMVMGGIRTAAVQVVATATLGAFVAGGGLGRYIIDGLAVQDRERVFAGALLVALLALATEVTLGWLERRTVSVGLRPRLQDVTRIGEAAGATAR